MTSKPYVGIKGSKREVFRSSKTPTAASHGHRFGGVIGPFTTVGGAEVMAKYGGNNPHLRDVADAERMAKRLRKEGKLR